MSGFKRIAIYSAILLLMHMLGLAGCSLQAQTLDENALKGMKWRQIGPFRGGRALAVTGLSGDLETYYFGAVAGGVWKTANGGLTWMPLTDKTGIMSVGAIAVAPSDPNVIYVGTGESCIRGNISYGDGIYKSLDGGKSWTHVGLEDTQHIAKIVVPTVLTKCAECSVRTTAAKLGKGFCLRTTGPARSTWYSIQIIRTFCSRRFGKRSARPGA